jgi:hypothetical protein
MRVADNIENTASIVGMLLLGLPRDHYRASSLARWLMPNNGAVLFSRAKREGFTAPLSSSGYKRHIIYGNANIKRISFF